MKPLILLACVMALFCATDAAAKSMSMPTYQCLQAIEELMAENKLQQAESKLNAMLADMPRRTEDCAYIYYTTGMLHLQRCNYRQAKKYFVSAYELDRFPEKTMLYVLQTLAGLSMQEERFEEAIAYYQSYMARASEPNKDVYIGLGTAYFYQKEYPDAIKTLEMAINQFTPKESPYLMLFSSYYELKQLGDATTTLERMIKLWPDKKQYWLQLSSLYIERQDYEKSLEIMQAALVKQYLIQENDILQYVYTLYEEHLPYKAAVALQKAIDQNVVEKNQKSYELLSTMYQEAKERPKAIAALKKASTYTENGKNDLCIAQLCFEMGNAFPEVIEYANRAIRKGVKQEGNANMLIAVAYNELGQMENAKKYLIKAAQYKKTQKASSQWIESL